MRLPPAITSRTNPRVKALRAAFLGRATLPGELTALEGEHLLSEAVRAGLRLGTVFVREGDEAALDAPALRGLRAAEWVVLSRDVFDSAVQTATPQGLAATLPIPELSPLAPESQGALLVLENLQDPGNVGTLIRSAAAFGAAGVVLVGECANPWAPKVLRASAGAVFHAPVLRMRWPEVQQLGATRRLLAAVPQQAGALDVTSVPLERAAFLIGNEGRGLTDEALDVAEARITIPCRIESFNAAVAGSLLLYEAFRQSQDGAKGPA